MNGLHRVLAEQVQDRLKQETGAAVRLERAVPVSGGSINQAYRLETTAGPFFLKVREDAPPSFFCREADGLRRLREAGAQVPEVVAVTDRAVSTGAVLEGGGMRPDIHKEREDERTASGAQKGIAGQGDGVEETEWGVSFLLMEWVPKGSWTPPRMRALGRQLASVHRKTEEAFGLAADNYIGLLPQSNRRTAGWPEFYREQRLKVQWRIALEKGRMTPSSTRSKRLERLLEKLDEWLPTRPPASVLHGDLWSGNVLPAADGRNLLIDPAVYAGHREVDLAFSEYFGGFSREFYEGYEEVYPLDPAYEDRKPLYQLYYILVHLNLFGEAYGPAADAVLRRYVGG